MLGMPLAAAGRGAKMTLATGSVLWWVGCVGQVGPATGPSPADATDESSEVPEAAADSAPGPLAGVDPVTEDPVAPAPVSEEFDGPTPEEIDRAIHSALGPDPIGLVRNPEVAEARLPLEINDRVEAWINYFQNVIPERFGLYLARKGAYERMIRRKLRERGMPQDLIYLALIESGMNPNAYSRAAAVGMWQFIGSTGRWYDLEVSHWVDERRDPEKATDAALSYLQDLYDRFGSWYLAAAAYNGGPGRVSRGLARVDGGTFWDLADARLLRSETRNYVPKLIAAAIIGNDPERYGFSDIEAHDVLVFETVTVPDAMSFDVLAEVAGTDEETLRSLNPQFPQRVTPPGREVELKVPVGARASFAARYAEVPADKRVSFTYHVVQRGQTLGHIASRYGVTVSGLRAANGNVDPRRLSIGRRLVIPRPTRVAEAGGSTASGGPRVSAQSRLESTGPVTVVVRRGDSLWSIARRHSVSTRDLMQWNNLSSTVIKPGERIQIRR